MTTLLERVLSSLDRVEGMLLELSGQERSEASDASQSPLDEEDNSPFVTSLIADVLSEDDPPPGEFPKDGGQALPGISRTVSVRASPTVREEVAGATVVTKKKKVFTGADVTMAQDR